MSIYRSAPPARQGLARVKRDIERAGRRACPAVQEGACGVEHQVASVRRGRPPDITRAGVLSELDRYDRLNQASLRRRVEQLEHVLRKRGKVNVQRLLALEHLEIGLGHFELVEEERIALCACVRVAKSR